MPVYPRTAVLEGTPLSCSCTHPIICCPDAEWSSVPKYFPPVNSYGNTHMHSARMLFTKSATPLSFSCNWRSFSMYGTRYPTAFFITRADLMTWGRNIRPEPNRSPTTDIPWPFTRHTLEINMIFNSKPSIFMPVLEKGVRSRCELDLWYLLTSKSSQFIFVPNCTKGVRLAKFPQAVYEKSC